MERPAVPGAAPGTGNTEVNSTDVVPAPTAFAAQGGEADKKQLMAQRR